MLYEALAVADGLDMTQQHTTELAERQGCSLTMPADSLATGLAVLQQAAALGVSNARLEAPLPAAAAAATPGLAGLMKTWATESGAAATMQQRQLPQHQHRTRAAVLHLETLSKADGASPVVPFPELQESRCGHGLRSRLEWLNSLYPLVLLAQQAHKRASAPAHRLRA